MIKIRHTGIVTKNLQKSLIFWEKLIGFTQVNSQIETGKLIDSVLGYKNVKVKTIKLKDKKKNLIELLYFYNSPNLDKKKISPYTPGYTHISITVKNIQSIYKKLKKYKIQFNSKPKITPDKKHKMTYCKTPEGAFLELVEEL
jgi:catechol 2,3-dioxygenase-like lactoylglutathione lyase family enzyme